MGLGWRDECLLGEGGAEDIEEGGIDAERERVVASDGWWRGGRNFLLRSCFLRRVWYKHNAGQGSLFNIDLRALFGFNPKSEI